MATELTLDQLIDRTLFDLGNPGELGRQVVVGSTALTTVSSTTLTLSDASGVNPSDIIELGNELVLVTSKSSDATPVLTVSRGYYGTTKSTHAEGTVGTVNPTHPRRRIAEAIRRSFTRLEALGIPYVKSATVNRETGEPVVQLPVDVREVYQVLYIGSDGKVYEMSRWEYFDDLPTAKFSSGKALNVSELVEDEDDLEIVYRAPYRWSTYPSDPTGDSTIEIPEGAEDLPSLYAAAWLVSNREISRLELDRAEEWGRTEMTQRGAGPALVRAKWQEFYRALDEARRLDPPPQTIHFKRRSTRF